MNSLTCVYDSQTPNFFIDFIDFQDPEEYERYNGIMFPVERPKGGLASLEELNDRKHVSQPDASAGDFVELVKNLLAFRAEDRLSPEAALGHPFFSRNDSYGGPPVAFRAEDRLSPDAALEHPLFSRNYSYGAPPPPDLSLHSLQAIPTQDEPLDLSTKPYRPE